MYVHFVLVLPQERDIVGLVCLCESVCVQFACCDRERESVRVCVLQRVLQCVLYSCVVRGKVCCSSVDVCVSVCVCVCLVCL